MNNYFILDSLNIIFLAVLIIVTIGVLIYQELKDWKYNVTFLLFFLSMVGAILSNHLGLTWVFIEATTLTSAYLILQSKTEYPLEAAWKYVFLCSIGISMAFVGIILLLIGSNTVSSLFYNNLYANATVIEPFWLKLSYVFILIGFGTKAGLAPVHFWLPDAHAEAQSPISAMLSATLLNSAFLVILRYTKLVDLAGLYNYAHTLLFIMGLLSIIITAIYVFKIVNYKRMLAYSSIENMGIIAIGIASGGVGIFAAMLHLIAHSLIKSSFFMTAGNILHTYKTKQVLKVQGLLEVDKLSGCLWVLCGIFILGIPPSPIFFTKFLILKQLFIEKQFILAGFFLFLITIVAYGIIRVVIKMSFSPSNIKNELKLPIRNYLPQICFLSCILVLGFYIPNWLYSLIQEAIKCI
jgi:hydrogenase-4 component F